MGSHAHLLTSVSVDLEDCDTSPGFSGWGANSILPNIRFLVELLACLPHGDADGVQLLQGDWKVLELSFVELLKAELGSSRHDVVANQTTCFHLPVVLRTAVHGDEAIFHAPSGRKERKVNCIDLKTVSNDIVNARCGWLVIGPGSVVGGAGCFWL